MCSLSRLAGRELLNRLLDDHDWKYLSLRSDFRNIDFNTEVTALNDKKLTKLGYGKRSNSDQITTLMPLFIHHCSPPNKYFCSTRCPQNLRFKDSITFLECTTLDLHDEEIHEYAFKNVSDDEQDVRLVANVLQE